MSVQCEYASTIERMGGQSRLVQVRRARQKTKGEGILFAARGDG